MNIEQLRKKRKELIAKKDWNGALEVINLSLDIEHTASRLCIRGNILSRLGRFDEAMESYLSAQQIEPNNQDVISGMQHVASMLKNTEKTLSLQNLRKKREHLSSLNKWSEVVIVLDKMIAIEPLPERFVNRGNTLLLLNNLEGAMKSFEAALKLDAKSQGAKKGIEKVQRLRQTKRLTKWIMIAASLLLCVFFIALFRDETSVQEPSISQQQTEPKVDSFVQTVDKKNPVTPIQKEEKEGKEKQQPPTKSNNPIETISEKKNSSLEKEFEAVLNSHLQHYTHSQETDLAIQALEQVTELDTDVDTVAKTLTAIAPQKNAILIRALKSPKLILRKAAVKTAVDVGLEISQVIPTLISQFTKESDGLLKKQIAETLVMIDKNAHSVPKIADALEEGVFTNTVAAFRKEQEAKREQQQATQDVQDMENSVFRKHRQYKKATAAKIKAEQEVKKDWKALKESIAQQIAEAQQHLRDLTNQQDIASAAYKSAEEQHSREKEYAAIAKKRIKMAENAKSTKYKLRHLATKSRKKAEEFLQLALKEEEAAVNLRKKAERDFKKGKGSEKEESLKAELKIAKAQEELAIKEVRLAKERLAEQKKEEHQRKKDYSAADDLLSQEKEAYKKAESLEKDAAKLLHNKKQNLNSLNKEKTIATDKLREKNAEIDSLPKKREAAKKHLADCERKEQALAKRYASVKQYLKTAQEDQETATQQRLLLTQKADEAWLTMQQFRQSKCKKYREEIRPVSAPQDKIMKMALIAMASKNKEVKLDAIKLSKKHQILTAIPKLIEYIHNDDKKIRLEATIAIGTLGPTAHQATPVLLQSIRSWSLADSQKAGKSLVQISSSKNLEHLKQALYDSDNTIQLWASKALAHIGKDSVPFLIFALKNENEYTKKYAVKALAAIGSDASSAIPALKKLLIEMESKNSDKADLKNHTVKALDIIQKNE